LHNNFKYYALFEYKTILDIIRVYLHVKLISVNNHMVTSQWTKLCLNF